MRRNTILVMAALLLAVAAGALILGNLTDIMHSATGGGVGSPPR